MKSTSSFDHSHRGENTSHSAEPFKLGEEDVCAMVRLLGEVAEVPGDQAVKRRHLLSGLAQLVDSDVWMWSIFSFGNDGRATSISLLHGGMTPAEFDQVVRGSTDPHRVQSEIQAMNEQFLKVGQLTRRRRQLISDEYWYADEHVRTYRQGFLDDSLYHFRWVDDRRDVVSGIGLHRRWGREPFTERDARLVHIIMGEVHWLHRAAVPDGRADGTDVMTPRQRAVLALLLQGRSRKEIAAGLEISINTIGDHIDALYRHFNVDGRAALIKRFMVGDGGDLS